MIRLSVQMHMENGYKENSKKIKQQPTCGMLKSSTCTRWVCCCLNMHADRHILIADKYKHSCKIFIPFVTVMIMCAFIYFPVSLLSVWHKIISIDTFLILTGERLEALIVLIYTLKGCRWNMWMSVTICREMVHLFPYLCLLLFFPSSLED